MSKTAFKNSIHWIVAFSWNKLHNLARLRTARDAANLKNSLQQGIASGSILPFSLLLYKHISCLTANPLNITTCNIMSNRRKSHLQLHFLHLCHKNVLRLSLQAFPDNITPSRVFIVAYILYYHHCLLPDYQLLQLASFHILGRSSDETNQTRRYRTYIMSLLQN